MVFNSKIWLGMAVLALYSIGCQQSVSTKRLQLSTVSSTDTVKEGTPAGMHLYMDKTGGLDIQRLLLAQGIDPEKLKEVKINQIRIKVDLPEKNFNPAIIRGFNTAFTKEGVENTVIESDELNYTSRTYIIDIRDEVSSFSEIEKAFNLSGGLNLRDKLEFDIVLTTEVFLEAEVLY